MLSFSLTNENQSIQITCDDAGLSQLVEVLTRLRDSGGHTHLWGPSYGGRVLSDVTPFGKPAIGEVIITLGGD